VGWQTLHAEQPWEDGIAKYSSLIHQNSFMQQNENATEVTKN